MSVRVQIPGPLRSLTGGADEVQVEAKDVGALIEALEGRHQGIRDRLCDPSGELRNYVRLFLNEEDIRFLDGKQTALKSGDTVAIVPAIAGGARRPSTRREVAIRPAHGPF